MSREEAQNIRKQEKKSRRVDHEDEHTCILCEGVIEYADHDTYFVTGYCRHCTEALKE